MSLASSLKFPLSGVMFGLTTLTLLIYVFYSLCGIKHLSFTKYSIYGVALLVGFLKVKVGLFNPVQPDRVVEVEALVDTGAVYSAVGSDVLEQLGVKPLERRKFRAFGGFVERDIGEVGVVLMGRRRVVPVVFGEKGDPAILGVTALEIFGLEVDVVRGVLREAELLLL
jgi:clan AA aspartic protease